LLRIIRKDLYYRLAGKILTIPNLREITEDLPTLIDHLTYKMEDNRHKRNETIDYFKNRIEELENHHWPGNVRELANYVRRRLKLGKSENIELGEYELEGKSQENTQIILPARQSQDYAVDATFDEIDPSVTIAQIKGGNIQLESPDELRSRYINHVHKCLANTGASNAIISKQLQISINTLRKHIKNE
jgi:DNA-binding NtrC family response regulator